MAGWYHYIGSTIVPRLLPGPLSVGIYGWALRFKHEWVVQGFSSHEIAAVWDSNPDLLCRYHVLIRTATNSFLVGRIVELLKIFNQMELFVSP